MSFVKVQPASNALESYQAHDAYYDRDYWLKKGNKSKRFDRIKPEIVDELYKKRVNYQWIRNMAVQKLQDDIYERLQFLNFVNKTPIKTKTSAKCDQKQAEKISDNIFSWSYKDFVARRKISNCAWLDVLQRHSSAECLQQQKVDKDLKELQKYLDLIFKGILTSVEDRTDLNALTGLPLRDAQLYVEVEKNLINDNEILKKNLEGVRNTLAGQLINQQLFKQRCNLLRVEEIVSNTHVWSPIELKYSLNWYKNKVDQAQYKMDLMVYKYKIQIQELLAAAKNEVQVGSSILNTYYSETEKYKNLLTLFQNQYDIEFEHISNKVAYKRFQLEKLRNEEMFLKTEIKRFHEEIEKRLEKEEKERLAEEQLRQEEEERQRQAELLKKKKKTATTSKTSKKTKTQIGAPKGQK